MDVLKCEAFLAAVERGSILAASNKLNYTSSGVNRMISALEDELNVTLLARSRSGVTLTEIGERLLPVIRQFVECSAQIYEICKEEHNYIHETITIGAYHDITEHVLPVLLNKFKLQYPGVQVHVVEGPHSMLLPMLKDHDLDCCILCSSDDPEIDFEPLYREQLVALLRADRSALCGESFPVKELERWPFICFGDRPVELESVLREKKIKLDIRYPTRSVHTVYKMVEEGLGISVNTESCIKNQSEKVAVLPLDPPTFVDIGLVLPKNKTSPIVKRFADLMVAAMGQ